MVRSNVDLNGEAGHANGNGVDHVDSPIPSEADIVWREAQGASAIGPFVYVPPMGYREYWYPGVYRKEVGTKKPVFVKIMGADIVFFWGKADKVYALIDWCPHRSARLSQGESVFPGTIPASTTATPSTVKGSARPG